MKMGVEPIRFTGELWYRLHVAFCFYLNFVAGNTPSHILDISRRKMKFELVNHPF
jgi:hypothetical protein